MAAINLARELVRTGHEVDYVTSHYAGLAREEIQEGVRLFREPVIGRKDLHTATILSMLSYPKAAFSRAAKLSRQQPYDVVHTHFAIPSGPGGYLASKWLRLPNVLSVYGGDIYDPSKKYSPHRHPVLKFAVKRVLNQADIIIPESEDLCRRTRDIYKTRTPVQRIPLGFVPAPFTPASRAELGLRDDRVYAIAVSRLVRRKDYPTLLKALHAAGVDKLELVIVGDGPEEPALRALTAELGMKERVHFIGYVDDSKKYQYLQACDFFALATLHEGFGIVYQEAMHVGLPVVTTDEGGQTDFLEEGRNALLSRPGDIGKMAASLKRMAEDDERRGEMSENNRADIQGHYVETVAREYVKLYESVRRK